MRILLKRADSLGDVCEVTPVAHRLRLQYPDAEIDAESSPHCQSVWRDNPDGVGLKRDVDYDQVYDLNMVSERCIGKVHPVESLMEAVFCDRGGSTQLRLAVGEAPDLGVDWGKVICLHAARSWPNRTLPWQFWRELSELLVERGYTVVSMGTRQDWPMGYDGIINTYGLFDLKQQLGILQASRAFIASQSGPLIFAQATDVPIISLNTINHPWFLEHDRHGLRGWRMHHINAPIECFGCYHEIKEPVTFLPCKRNDNACVNLFDPKQVAALAEEVVHEAQAA